MRKTPLKSILFLILFVILTGCAQKPFNITKDLSQDEIRVIKDIASAYNESNPQIINIKPGKTDDTKEPMYIVFLRGNFSNSSLNATDLEFSMLKNGKKVWALIAYNGESTNSIWQEAEINIKNLK